MMRRRTALAMIGLLAVPCAARAAVPTDPSPSAPIAALNAGLLQVMQSGPNTTFAARMAIMSPVVEHAFDLKLILQNSVGPSKWATISETDKAELIDVFTQFTIASYVANFKSYSGEKFVISPDLRHVGQDVVVQTRIIPTNGETTRLDYVMRETDSGWHVVDILLDGSISRVAVTRSDFRSLLSQGDATKLIDSLRSKVASLQAEVTQ
jgi:phospholipid transport system substrate-binding protein